MNDKEFEQEFGMTIQEFEEYCATGDWFIDESSN